MTFITNLRTALKTSAVCAALAVSTLAPAGMANAFQAGFIQSLSVTSTRGTAQMDQFYNQNTVHASKTRVCLVNMGQVERTFTHAVPEINPLRAAPGTQSCANFSSGSRVAYGMIDGMEPAQANKAMVMSLGAFKGGTVTFVWR